MWEISLLLVLLFLCQVQALYFLVHVSSSCCFPSTNQINRSNISSQETPKCFTFEQPRDTPMFFKYEILDEGREIIFDLFYGTDPKPELQIMHKILTEASGHVDFTADNDGHYSYCVMQSTQYQQIPSRLSLHLVYGFDDEHYDKLIKEHNFDEVNLQVHKLNDLLTMSLNEADFQKHKEVEYHDETEKMNNAALWWPVVQVSGFYLRPILFRCLL
jgi:hypothetical protein